MVPLIWAPFFVVLQNLIGHFLQYNKCIYKKLSKNLECIYKIRIFAVSISNYLMQTINEGKFFSELFRLTFGECPSQESNNRVSNLHKEGGAA